jgi:hypothetical protein
MIARRLTLAVLVSVSVLACALGAGAGFAVAATTTFGEEGTHSGQLRYPYGLAINQTSHDVYVSDHNNFRIDKFTDSGSFQLAWGVGVNEEAPAEELQTCTASCTSGTPGAGAGAYAGESNRGVAVDNDPSSASHGDVYVVDWENFRVQKFDSEGRFLLMFGGGVLAAGATGTGDLTAGSKTITSVNTTSKAFLLDQTITGAGIAPGTKIAGRNEGTITLSQAATAPGTGVALTVAEAPGNVPNNERQTVTIEGTPMGGTFTLTFTSPQPDSTEQTTAPIADNAPAPGAGSVQQALEALSNIGAGNVAVSGSPGGPYTVEFKGAHYADTNVEQLRPREEGLEYAEHVTAVTPVEGHSEPEVCATASICQGGAPGTAHRGQFQWDYEGSYIAVGPGGDVYVGDKGRVQIFEPTGAYKQEISLAGLSSEEQVSALAVDTSGDVFVVDGFAGGGVHEFEPNGMEKLTKFDENSFAIGAIALDATGDVYVADGEPSFHVLKYDPTGTELASFGLNAVEFARGMAYDSASNDLYVTDAGQANDVKVLTPPPPGPLIGGESATPALRGEATFEATINPEGHSTTYHWEYLTEQQFNQDGGTFGTGTVTTTPASLTGTEFEDEHVEAKLPEAALVPGETYRWRVVATDSLNQTATSVPHTLEETPSALVDGPWATGVTATSATLAARVDPQGASTSYRLEYGTSTAYGHVLNGNVGAGSEFVSISRYIQELAPGTTYHYRIVTRNECETGRACTGESADHTFTTLPAGAGGPALPDGRAWELVTPMNTKGDLFDTVAQAASDGSALTDTVGGTPLGENPPSHSLFPSRILARRSDGGWETQDVSPPIHPPKEGQDQENLLLAEEIFYLFSPDLTAAVFSPQGGNGTLTAEALEGTPYFRSSADGSYVPLLTSANTPPGTILTHEEIGTHAGVGSTQVHVLAGTPDLHHLVLGSPLKLTAEAVSTGQDILFGIGNLYEWSGGRLQLVSILPSGKPACEVNTGVGCEDQGSVELAGESGGDGQVPRAVSSDGRRVAWTRGNTYTSASRDRYQGLYVRDTVEERTVKLGGPFSRYQTMSSDGSRVFFIENGDLYVYEAGVRIDLTASHGTGETSAGVQESVTDISEDGASVYFVANGVLGDGGEHGATSGGCEAGAPPSQKTCNLYLSHYSGSRWEAPKFIATLSSEDEHSWHAGESLTGGAQEPRLTRVTSRVSPDGRFLAFMSSRSLTGYDNVDANSAANRARDEEAFLYDSSTGRLVCVSCDPSGARPHGVPSGEGTQPRVDEYAAWGELGHPHWLAGSLPAWELVSTAGDTVHQPRYLSDSGRLFFNSPEALVPQDTNGFEDVYQYEPPGVGDCTGASATFNATVGGCVSLVTSGQSAGESVFLDASESGDDVFVLTAQHLTGADIDTGYDVWDAHVCSSSAPCLAPPVAPPPCSSGDSCKPAPAQQPELFGAGPSETFSGTGNVVPASVPAVKPKIFTRAQRLAGALGSCRKRYKRSKKRRAACERAAHKRYGHAAKRSHKANTTKRGGK